MGMKLKSLIKNVTFQVIVCLCLGVLLGHFSPAAGQAMQVFSDLFIRLIRMVIPPIAFFTIVIGLAEIRDLKQLGQIGGRALIYFEVVSTLALVVGLIVMSIIKPGVGFDRSHIAGPMPNLSQYTSVPMGTYMGDFFLNIVPDNAVAAFAKGDLLQIVFFGILFGCAAVLIGDDAKPVIGVAKSATEILFKIVGLIMRLAPLGAFGAMAFTVGKFGVGSILVLGNMLAAVYITSTLFVVVVLGSVSRLYGFSILRFIRFIGDETLIVFGTCSSETVLPRLLTKLNRLGVSRSCVGLVLPVGYSFNADGTALYLSMAALFIAQAYGIDLSLWQQLGLLFLLVVTSKGSGSVAGSGFVVLAATLSATHILPVEGLLLLIGVDRFMSEARSVTNVIGNSLASVIVAKMSGEFDPAAAEGAYAEAFGPGIRFQVHARALGGSAPATTVDAEMGLQRR